MNWAARGIPGAGQVPALADCTIPAQPSWAHASGWNQMPGPLRRVSCVVMAGADRFALSQGLPRLSDALTECGYPWEVIILFAEQDLAAARVASGWAQLPGFWSVAMPPGRMGESLGIALAAARGDAVVIVGDPAVAPLHLLASAIAQWDAGAPLVLSLPEQADAVQALAWPELVQRLRGDGLPPSVAEEGFHFALLDRQLVELLLL